MHLLFLSNRNTFFETSKIREFNYTHLSVVSFSKLESSGASKRPSGNFGFLRGCLLGSGFSSLRTYFPQRIIQKGWSWQSEDSEKTEAVHLLYSKI